MILRDCRFLLFAGLLGIAFSSALFLHGPAEILFGPVALLGVALALLTGWQGLPRPSAPSLFLSAWWLYLAVSSLWSSAPFVSLLFLFLLLPLAWLFLALPGFGAARVQGAFFAVLGGLSLLALATLAQFLFFSAAMGPRIHAPFLDPNSLAAAMLVGLLPACAYFLADGGNGEDGCRHKAFGVLALLFAAGLLATASRSGLLAALAGGALIVLLLPVSTRRLLYFIAACAIVACAMEFYARLAVGHGPSAHLTSREATNFTDRLALWSATSRMIPHHPLAGTGLGTFSYWYPRFRARTDFSNGYFVHDDLLQLWEEAGILAPLLFLGFVGTYCRRALRARRGGDGVRAVTAMAVLLALLLQSLVNYVFYLPAILLPLGVVLAWGEGTRGDAPPPPFLSPAVFRTGLVIAAVVAVQWIVRAEIGIVAVRAAAAAETKGDLDAMGAAVARAARYAPATDYVVPQFAARWQHGRAARLGDLAAPEQGLAAIDRAQGRNTGFAYLNLTRAQLLEDEKESGRNPGGRRQAELILEALLRDDPLCLEARYVLSSFYQADGNKSDALGTMGEALNWPRPKTDEKKLINDVAGLCAANGDMECANQLVRFGADSATPQATAP